MPIKGVSDIIRLPRLGKIRLGEKVSQPGKATYPKPVDYFVCPPEVQKALGQEKPKELHIMFPTDDPSQFTSQWLKAYSQTQGLTCIGDGDTCRRKVDTKTGAIADHNTQTWEWKEGLPCDPQECRLYLKKGCKRVMNLQFILPAVPGFGVWQIDTSSFYSIVNINNLVKLLLSCGRCRLVPVTLSIGPHEVAPQGEKKKTVYVLQPKVDLTFAQVQQLTAPLSKVLLPETVEDEERPEDLFPDEPQNGNKAETPAPTAGPSPAPQPATPVGFATPAQQQEIIGLGKKLGYRDADQSVSQALRLKKHVEWEEMKEFEAAQVIKEWNGILAKREIK